MWRAWWWLRLLISCAVVTTQQYCPEKLTLHATFLSCAERRGCEINAPSSLLTYERKLRLVIHRGAWDSAVLAALSARGVASVKGSEDSTRLVDGDGAELRSYDEFCGGEQVSGPVEVFVVRQGHGIATASRVERRTSSFHATGRGLTVSQGVPISSQTPPKRTS